MRLKRKASKEEMNKIKSDLITVSDLDVIRRADLVHQALEVMTIAEAAKAAGKSSLFIGQYSKLYWFPDLIKQLIHTKKIGMVEAIQAVAQYDAYDPNKYSKALKDIKEIIESKNKPEKEPTQSEMNRAFRNLIWAQEELEALDKPNIVQSRLRAAVDLFLGRSKKQNFKKRLNQITDQASG